MTYWPLRAIVEQATGDRPIDELAACAGRPPSAVRQVAAAVGLRAGQRRRGHRLGVPARDRGTRPRRPLVLVARRRAPGRARAARPARRRRRAAARRARAGRLGRAARRARRAPSGWERSPATACSSSARCPDAAVAALLDAIDGGRLDPARARADRRGGRRQPAVPRAARRLLDERGRPAERFHPRCTRCSPRASTGSTPTRALRARARRGRGRRVRAGEVHALADGITRAELEQALRAAGRCATCSCGATARTVRFRHGLVREVAYASLAKSARARLHERHADWLERLGAELPEADARIGFHLETACRYEQRDRRRRPARRASAAGRRLAAAARVARSARRPAGRDRLPRPRRGAARHRRERGRRAAADPRGSALVRGAGDSARAEQPRGARRGDERRARPARASRRDRRSSASASASTATRRPSTCPPPIGRRRAGVARRCARTATSSASRARTT